MEAGKSFDERVPDAIYVDRDGQEYPAVILREYRRNEVIRHINQNGEGSETPTRPARADLKVKFGFGHWVECEQVFLDGHQPRGGGNKPKGYYIRLKDREKAQAAEAARKAKEAKNAEQEPAAEEDAPPSKPAKTKRAKKTKKKKNAAPAEGESAEPAQDGEAPKA
jgi:hypothetical protein